jgi:hypothetical protein
VVVDHLAQRGERWHALLAEDVRVGDQPGVRLGRIDGSAPPLAGESSQSPRFDRIGGVAVQPAQQRQPVRGPSAHGKTVSSVM